MRVERALLEELPEKKFNIGYQGEQNHTQVIISCPIMFRDYPDAVASMVVKPPQGDLYPVSLTRDGNDLTWDVSDADVAIPGEGILQLTFTDGEGEEAEIIKTVYGAYSVNASLVADGEAPDPVQSWLDEAGAALSTFETEIGEIRKITTATEEDEGKALSPKTVVNGKVTEWEYIDLADPEVVTQAIDDWLDDHPEATTTVQDGAITEAKLNDSLKEDLAWQTDVDGLKSAIVNSDGDNIPHSVVKKMVYHPQINLFDIDSITASKNIDVNGTITDNDSYNISDYIKVKPGHTIYAYYISNGQVYRANMAIVCAYNGNKTVQSSAGTGASANNYTVPNGIEYIRISYYANLGNEFMMLDNASSIPSGFIPYYESYYTATDDFIREALEELGTPIGKVTKEDTDFWVLEKSANLFDKNAITSGEYFNTDGSIRTANYVFRSYVELDGAGTYCFNVMGNFYGLANAVKIPTFDKNKSFIKTITGSTEATSASNKDLMTLVISQQDISDGVVYIGYSEHPDNLNDLMVVKSATYPGIYIPFFEFWSIPDLKNVDANPLFGKKVVFDGDSICAGNGSAMGDYGNGWAGRIGVNNGMEYYNVGVSGACITAETYFGGGTPRHWVSRYIDTIHTNYPDADYIIAEGGTNDADNFYNDPSKLGTFDETDFTGPFDDTTFYGAMDSWCKKALTYFPKAKIGFIVAQKMGLGFVTYTKNRYDYFTYAAKVCKKWGIPVLNLWDEGQLRPDVTSMYDPQYNTIETATEHGLPYYDGQHLTAYGYDVISPKIAEWMKGL